MAQYIEKSALVAEIEKLMHGFNLKADIATSEEFFDEKVANAEFNLCKHILNILNALEVKEVDLEIFGAIARHVIAVKEHVEDMRFDEEEWLTLEKIGYPERFKSQKGE